MTAFDIYYRISKWSTEHISFTYYAIQICSITAFLELCTSPHNWTSIYWHAQFTRKEPHYAQFCLLYSDLASLCDRSTMSHKARLHYLRITPYIVICWSRCRSAFSLSWTSFLGRWHFGFDIWLPFHEERCRGASNTSAIYILGWSTFLVAGQ